MWERGARHNPLTERNQKYLDHRAILPEDPSMTGFMGFRKLSNPYRRIYYIFGGRILFNNNMQVQDRERLKSFFIYNSTLYKNILVISIIPGIAYASALSKTIFANNTFKLLNLANLVIGTFLAHRFLNGYVKDLDNQIGTYYMNKYENILVDNLNEVDDKRRKFFRPDTSVYYRQTHQEILDSKSPSQLHDPSIYYGPHPYDDYQNAQELIEINSKFMHGHSAFDEHDAERVLGEKIDIKRRIRDLPTVEEFKKI
jgi:hypothetical protein